MKPVPSRSKLPPSLLALALATACGPAHLPLLPPGSLLDDVAFTEYTPLATNLEMARRTLPPLTFRQIQQSVASGQALQPYSIDLDKERFTVYVPAGPAPTAGYGLLVFIAPWSEPTRPQRWRPPLDRHGVIFVAASGSGNESAVLDRRLPLALLAADNVRARYPVDPARVYVGGMSGGSRAALLTALAYPDLFRGALLNAGADPIGGERGIYLPPADLFRRFQRSRVLLVSGDQDVEGHESDRIALASLRDWCVLGVDMDVLRRTGHTPLDASALDRALDFLDRPSSIGAGEQARCDAHLLDGLTARLADAEAALARGDRDAARARIKAIDARYGGLGAPAILELADRLDALPP